MKDSILFTKTQISQEIADRINEVLNRQAVSQASLVRLMREAGYSVSQSDVSKMLSGKAKVSAYFLVAISEVLGVSLDELASGRQNAAPLRISGKNFEVDPAVSDAFRHIIGEYFVYFEATNRREQDKLVSGRLSFRRREGFCEAVMILEQLGNINKLRKVYLGQLILSRKMQGGYVFLYNEGYGEISVFAFRYRDFLTRDMVCRMALAVTLSSGDVKNVISHRLLLSRRKLDEEEQEAAVSYLRISETDFYVEASHLERYLMSDSPQEDLPPRDLLQKVTETLKRSGRHSYLLITESDIRSVQNKISLKEMARLKQLLRGLAENMLPNIQIGDEEDAELYSFLNYARKQKTGKNQEGESN